MRSLTVVLVLIAASVASAQADIRSKKSGWADLGVRLQDKGQEATIAEVYAGSAADKAGLKAGWTITKYNDRGGARSEEIMAALWSMEKDREVRLELYTGKDMVTREVKVDWIEGQKVPGQNNKVHHPPAIRGIALDPEKLGEDAKLSTVYGFDLVVSFDWALSEQEMSDAKKMIEDAGRIWFDAMDGQMYWRRVEMHTRKDAWDRAHYRIQRKQGGYLGIEHVTPGGQCIMHFSALDRTSAWVWVHEAGHMQLGSGDEYPYAAGDKKEICKCLMGGRNNIELCVETNHDYAPKASCWDNAKRWYPNLVRVTEATKGPTLAKLPKIIVVDPPAAPAEDLEARLNRVIEERMAALRLELRKAVKDALGSKEPDRPRKRGYLGIGAAEPDEEDADALKKNGYEAGIKIQIAPDGAAEKAGLQDGDIIVEFNGEKMPDVETLAPKVQGFGSGREAKVVVIRDGKKMEVKVVLGTHPEDE